MHELALTRVFGDRHLYAFDGVGSLRLTGVRKRGGVAEAAGHRWEISHLGLWKRDIQATEVGGSVVGEFAGRALTGGGEVRWYGEEFALRRGGLWRERYALTHAGGALATIDGRSWGSRPVTVTGEDLAAIDPGLLLFTAFVVRSLAVAAAAAAAG